MESTWERREKRRCAHADYESEMSVHEKHDRRYRHERKRAHSREPSYMEHSHGYCERCAQRDLDIYHDRYHDLLEKDRYKKQCYQVYLQLRVEWQRLVRGEGGGV